MFTISKAESFPLLQLYVNETDFRICFDLRDGQSPAVPCHNVDRPLRAHCYLTCFLVTGRDVRGFK